jgi:hypothetical protein
VNLPAALDVPALVSNLPAALSVSALVSNLPAALDVPALVNVPSLLSLASASAPQLPAAVVTVVSANPAEAGGSAPLAPVGTVSPALPGGSGIPAVVAPATFSSTGHPPAAWVVSVLSGPVLAAPAVAPAAAPRWGFIDFLAAPAVGVPDELPDSGHGNGRHPPAEPENATGGGMRSAADGSAFNPALVGRSAWHPELSPGHTVGLIDATRGGRSAEAAPLPG